MANDASTSTGTSGPGTHDLQLVVETTSWLAAWFILPVWLSFQGVSGTSFLLYALGSGLLLAVGVAVDRPRAFEEFKDSAWFAGVSSLAVTVVGGSVFALTSYLRSQLW